MTGPESDDRELTAAQEEAVRRHLVAARYTEPVPGDVAERLDRVLAGLQSERSPTTTVVDLASRRRRRTARLLVAAAAVVVAGVGIGQIVDSDFGGGQSDSASTADLGAEAPEAATSDSPGNGAGDDRSPVSPTAGLSLPVVRDGQLRDAAARYSSPSAYEVDRTNVDLLMRSCVTAASDERVLPVSYHGHLAALLYHGPHDDVQRVDLYRCADGSTLVASVVIPAP